MSELTGLRELATGLGIALEGIRKILDAPREDDWIDQASSPLGRRRHLRLAKSGKFPSARKEGSRWLVKRSEIEAHIDAAPRPIPSPEVQAEQDDEALRASVDAEARRDRRRRKR